MARLVWDQTGERIAETGVKMGVIFPFVDSAYASGAAWNGLTSVSESPTGAEANPFYADNQKYIELMSDEEFAGSIGCFTYPKEFKACIGEKELVEGVSVGQQAHSMFAFCYRTEVVNDTTGLDYGYKLHIVYNALAGVSEREHTTINESPELEELGFDFTTTKVEVPGAKPTAHLVIDSTTLSTDNKAKLKTLENKLYGNEEDEATLLMPSEVAAIFAAG